MSAREKLTKILLPILILLIGFGAMRFLVLARPAPQKEVRENPGLLAEVMRVRAGDRTVAVTGTGTVQPRREAHITPQVSGRITRVDNNFVAGGLFKEGSLLFKIEAVDYKLAVDRARAALAQAEMELAQEESNGRIAKQEWARLARDETEVPNPLVLREPQQKKARAQVSSAAAQLKQAELDLQRTRVTAPFNGRIRSEEIDVGQYVRSGTSIAVLAGTDRADIVVPFSLDQLRWLQIPRQGAEAAGSPATVKVKMGPEVFTWPGRVVRSLGEVDPQGRMARVVVAVEDPYHLLQPAAERKPDLEVGMFVEVTIQGEVLSKVVAIPRSALRDGNTVWVVDDEEKLRIKPVEVARLERETVLIRQGLNEGERVVLTALQGAADGMKLRPIEQGVEQ